MPSLNLLNPLRRDPSRPTLKQRAATLKATAARLMRRPAPAAPAPAAEAPEEVDWYDPPPGFMASPAIEPSGFTRIESGIHREANRLLGIALAEISRRRAARPENLDEAARLAEDARLTKIFHINALASIASPEHIEITGWRYVPEATGQPKRTTALFDEIVVRWREWAAVSPIRDTFDDRVRSDRASDRLSGVIDAADALPPTLENLPAKALALAWISLVSTWEQGATRDSYAMDGRLGLDIDTAIAGRVRTTGV